METPRKQTSWDVRIGPVTVPQGLALAPMAGATSLPFRLLCRDFGAGLTVTEMVSSKGLVQGGDKTLHYLERDDSEDPVGAQVFGEDPGTMAEAARRVEDRGFHLVDINMGCPVPKITGSGAGCALMKTPDQAARVVEAMTRACSIPVTVKIRKGWEEKSAPAVARVLEAAGAAAITVHARTREQKYAGQADWDCIGEVKAAVKVPVFGNGDVDGPEKAVALQKQSGCDGLAIGRGALKTPWIFSRIAEQRQLGYASPPPTPPEIGQILLRFARGLIDLHGEKRAILMMRRLGTGFSKGLEGGVEFRRELVGIATYTDLENLARTFFTASGSPEPAQSRPEPLHE